MIRQLLVLTAVVTLPLVQTGCSVLGYFGGSEPPLANPVAPAATSSTHYRAFADADALAAYLRWTPGAPLLLGAHRGSPGPSLAENAVATFEHALNYAPTLIAADVRQTADGRLVFFHDVTLDRTTTGRGRLDAQPFEALRALRLLDPNGQPTGSRIATVEEGLAWAERRAVLLLDGGPGVRPEALVGAVRAARAENRVVVVTATLDELSSFIRLAPDLNYSASAPTAAEAEALLASGVDLSRVVASAGVGVPDPAVVRRLHAAGLRVQAATFGAPDSLAALAVPGPAIAYGPFLAAGADVLLTANVPSAALAIRPTASR